MGCNHVSHWAGSCIANYYADGVNYHADGLPHEPKKSHLMRLHNILAQHNRALMETPKQYGNEQYIIPNGQTKVNNKTFAYVYKAMDSSGDKLVFLCNIDNKDYTLKYNGMDYYVPATSVSLLDFEGTELYNTAKVSTAGLPTERVNTVLYGDLKFASYQEPFPLTGNNAKIRPDSAIMNKTPLEQIKLTNDTSEYVVYLTNLPGAIQSGYMLKFTGRKANAYIVYIDDEYIGTVADYEHSAGNLNMTITINTAISSGQHVLTIISSSLGISNGMPPGSSPDGCDMKGLVGIVQILDKNKGLINDLTNNGWSQYIGLTGEVLNIAGDGMNKVTWTSPPVTATSMTWYKTTFNTPSESILDGGVILVDIGKNSIGLNRGHCYINGMDLGHFNNVQQGGIMVQQFYFVPKDVLKANGGSSNTLVFIDEYGNTTLSNINIVSSTVVVPQS